MIPTTSTAKPERMAPRQLVERIAKELPAEIRSEHCRVMMYCESLPQDDEMLQILLAMQYLHLLMVRVPEQVMTEREKLEQFFGEAKRTLESAIKSGEGYYRELDQRLTRLPETVAA